MDHWQRVEAAIAGLATDYLMTGIQGQVKAGGVRAIAALSERRWPALLQALAWCSATGLDQPRGVSGCVGPSEASR